MFDNIWKDILQVRQQAPLVLNITNYVVMNNTANALLATGASPIMAHAIEETEEMVTICNSIVINIGTLDRFTVEAMLKAIKIANRLKKPIVLDPVGAGASSFRKETLKKILQSGTPGFIRGNASEIMVLAGLSIQSKGVDSSESSLNSLSAAIGLSNKYNCIITVSGETDIVTNGKETLLLKNGSHLMEKVTGLGCTATAIMGAFSAVQTNPLQAAISATAFMGICGEIAAEVSKGPGTLQLHLYDIMYNLTKEQVQDRIKIENINYTQSFNKK